jgi:glycosyltransferase 2 family protein
MKTHSHIDLRAALLRIERLVPRLALVVAPVAIFLLLRGQRDALGAIGSVGWRALALSATAFVLAPALQGLSFWLVLRFLTGMTRPLDAMLVWSRSYVLRYAPTGALAIAYRLSARQRLRASADQVLAAYAYEHVGALAAGAVACLVLFGAAGGLPPLLPLAIAAVTLLLTAALRPGIAGRGVQALSRRLGLHLSIVLEGRQLATVVVLNAVGWLGTGTAVYVLVSSVTADSPGFIWLVGSYTAGYLVGFVAPLAPGGLGAREATLVVLLGPRYGAAAALGISLAIRVANVVGELVTVAAVHAIHIVSAIRGVLRQRTAEASVPARV